MRSSRDLEEDGHVFTTGVGLEFGALLAPCRTPGARRLRLRAANAISADSVWGRRVLVTGGGGSIGSELVNQISRLGPSGFVSSIPASSTSIKSATRSSESANSRIGAHAFVTFVTKSRCVTSSCGKSPEIVFHAAALKHVPLLEEHNVVEAVLTNVLGTKVVMDLCASIGADFVAISTDKAVNPSSQMGLTKRVAEIYVHDRATATPRTRG